MGLIWPITIFACLLVICLTLLRREKMRLELDRRKQNLDFEPCAKAHEWVVIDVRPMEGVIPRHVTALYCCKRCGVHWSGVYAGEWTVETFMRTEADAEWWKREVAMTERSTGRELRRRLR